MRRSDPDTSRAAWRSVEPRAGTMRARVLALLREVGPMTGYLLACHLGAQHNNVSPRIAELHHAGLVADTGARQPGPDGKATQIVWRAVR